MNPLGEYFKVPQKVNPGEALTPDSKAIPPLFRPCRIREIAFVDVEALIQILK
jgi:hypothetical protein